MMSAMMVKMMMAPDYDALERRLKGVGNKLEKKISEAVVKPSAMKKRSGTLKKYYDEW